MDEIDVHVAADPDGAFPGTGGCFAPGSRAFFVTILPWALYVLAPMAGSVLVHEIYLSVQGESSWAGWPCVFIRLTGCSLRCSYCDTAYAFSGGSRQSLEQVLAEVRRLAEGWKSPGGQATPALPLVELTGGEPLLQKEAPELIRQCVGAGFVTLVETSGACDISTLPPETRVIMDLKCPSSGESQRMLPENIQHLRAHHEVKFVIASLQDYEWSIEQVQRHQLADRCQVLFSWAGPLKESQQDASLNPFPKHHQRITMRDLAEWVVRDRLPVRFQVQMHKVVWPADMAGV